MSWATWVKAEIEFNRKTYDTEYQVQDDIDESRKLQRMCRENLLVLASTDPKNLKEKDEEGNPLPIEETIRHKVNENIETLLEASNEEFRLQLLLENFDKRDGDYIRKDGNADEDSENQD